MILLLLILNAFFGSSILYLIAFQRGQEERLKTYLSYALRAHKKDLEEKQSGFWEGMIQKLIGQFTRNPGQAVKALQSALGGKPPIEEIQPGDNEEWK